MLRSFAVRLTSAFSVAVVFAVGGSSGAVRAQQTKVYVPVPIAPGKPAADTLTEKDIPTGQGGFARDYSIALKEGDQVAIDLSSDNFDTIVTLMAADGSTVAENDDGPDGSTNSLLFTRIPKSGSYIIRVRAFGESSGGPFTLKVTRLKPA